MRKAASRTMTPRDAAALCRPSNRDALRLNGVATQLANHVVDDPLRHVTHLVLLLSFRASARADSAAPAMQMPP